MYASLFFIFPVPCVEVSHVHSISTRYTNEKKVTFQILTNAILLKPTIVIQTLAAQTQKDPSIVHVIEDTKEMELIAQVHYFFLFLQPFRIHFTSNS